jgi:surface carbohydrate biosynthesis protein
MKLLYLPIEIFDREFPSRLLVAIEAISQGFSVVIIEQNEFKYNLANLPKGGLFYKDHNNCNAYPVFKEAKEKGFVTSALDEEGLVYFNRSRYAKARIGQECIKYTDIVFSWGDDQLSILSEHVNNHDTVIIKTGNPRFDVHIANREKREQYICKQNVLINTRFGSVNSGLYLDVDGYIERMRLVDEINTTEDEVFRRNYFLFMSQLFEKFLELIHALAEALPDYKITIRPHPSESSLPYINLSKQYKNVSVSDSNSLEDDLLGHDVLIHNGCTTGMEAIVTGIPVLVYEPVVAPEGDMALPNYFGEKYNTIQGIIERVSVVNNPYEFTEDLEKMSEYITSLQEANAHKKIVSAINDKVQFGYSHDSIENIKIRSSRLEGLKKLIKFIPSIFLSKYLLDKKLRWEYVSKKFPVISAKDIYQRIDDVMRYQKYIKFNIRSEDIVCKKLSSKGFVLYSKPQD